MDDKTAQIMIAMMEDIRKSYKNLERMVEETNKTVKNLIKKDELQLIEPLIKTNMMVRKNNKKMLKIKNFKANYKKQKPAQTKQIKIGYKKKIFRTAYKKIKIGRKKIGRKRKIGGIKTKMVHKTTFGEPDKIKPGWRRKKQKKSWTKTIGDRMKYGGMNLPPPTLRTRVTRTVLWKYFRRK